MSIDSIHKDTYEEIRIRGKHARVMDNFEYFRAYTRRKDTYMQLSINPLRRNWHELHEYVDFCNLHDLRIWFNTIVYPHSEALWTLDPVRLKGIHKLLSARELKPRPESTGAEVYEQNLRTFDNLVHTQIAGWLRDAEKRESDKGLLSEKQLERESRSLLEKELNRFIMTDAYIAPAIRKQKLEQYVAKLDRITTRSELPENTLFRRLYSLPVSVCIEYLDTKSSLEIAEVLKENG
jgi:hypothetical protein